MSIIGQGVFISGSQGGGTVEEKYINFYDYDGTLLYSYTEAEAQALSELPSVPAKKGFTIAWNYTLQEILAAGKPVNVGADYTPTDGAVSMDMLFSDDGRISPTFNFRISKGSMTIDWGDGSTPDVVSESSNDLTAKSVSHQMQIDSYPAMFTIKMTYSGEGLYDLTSGSPNVSFCPYPYHNFIINAHLPAMQDLYTTFSGCKELRSISLAPGTLYINQGALNSCFSLKFISLPRALQIGRYCFSNCYSLKSISIPPSVTAIGEYAFDSCYALKSVSLPNSITTCGNYLFTNCKLLESLWLSSRATVPRYVAYSAECLKKIIIPTGVTVLDQYAFQGLSSLDIIKIPASVAFIKYGVYNSCDYLHIIDMTDYVNESFPTLDTTLSNSGVPEDLIILVASDAKKTELSAMTNWSNYASKIQVQGE